MAIQRIFTQKMPISQQFGNYLGGFYKRWGMKGHDGVDFATPVGTPVMAGIDGVVTFSGFMPRGYGHYVIITKTREDGKSQLLFGHLSLRMVRTGDKVSPNTIIGKTGNTGASSGPHLHLSLKFLALNNKVINNDNGYYGCVDPLLYFSE